MIQSNKGKLTHNLDENGPLRASFIGARCTRRQARIRRCVQLACLSLIMGPIGCTRQASQHARASKAIEISIANPK
jgi:hypothetical protein